MKHTQKIIDPACGAGGFLSAIARHMIEHGASRQNVASSIFGIDKDRDLVNLASARLSVVTFARKQDVREGDILMVRDGTYLIGTYAFITRYDTQIVFQSHLYKLRVTDRAALSPYLLLAALSSAPVQRQIKAKRFTQDIIDSLGDRIYELVLPIPRDKAIHDRVTKMVEQAIQERIEARELARRACLELIG